MQGALLAVASFCATSKFSDNEQGPATPMIGMADPRMFPSPTSSGPNSLFPPKWCNSAGVVQLHHLHSFSRAWCSSAVVQYIYILHHTTALVGGGNEIDSRIERDWCSEVQIFRPWSFSSVERTD